MLKGYKLFIFIALILFLIISFLALRINDIKDILIEPTSISLTQFEDFKTEKGSTKEKSVQLKITDDLRYFINEEQVDFDTLEKNLLAFSELEEDQELTIVLRAEKLVPVNKIIEMMDIANRNKFKVILAVKPN